jgi:hypothetical protein
LFETTPRALYRIKDRVLASGFLFQVNLPITENALDVWSTSVGEDSWKQIKEITSQTLESKVLIKIAEMTQEEKERGKRRGFCI